MTSRLEEGVSNQSAFRLGVEVVRIKENPSYHFISDNAQGATKKFGVKSVSILARKP